MSKRKEIDPEFRVWLLEECLAGRMRGREAARRAGVSSSAMRKWISLYKMGGPAAFASSNAKRIYSEEIKKKVVKDYLNTNDNKLVFDTFAKAVQSNPDAHPVFHSDRGFQYTNRYFYQRLVNAGMTQSMSRVGRCIDNGPMEGFWGILKRERYYGRRFTNRAELVKMIRSYIHYYNTKRLQRNLGVLTPMEKHDLYSKAA